MADYDSCNELIFTDEDMKEILSRWEKDVSSWSNKPHRTNRTHSDFSTMLFQLLGSKHLVELFVRYPVTTTSHPATLLRDLSAAMVALIFSCQNSRMRGATGNIYAGLHEFIDMIFRLYFLQPDDLFLDIGANVGSYTILASGVCGAETWAFEPDPDSASFLRRNFKMHF